MSDAATYEIGQHVRILAGPRSGEMGKITHPIHFLLSDTWLCFVQFEDGETIPYHGHELELSPDKGEQPFTPIRRP